MRIFAFSLLLFAVTQLCGCVETQKPVDAQLGGSTPAPWEGGMSGMSGMGTSNR